MEQTITKTLVNEFVGSFNLYLFCSIIAALSLKELAIAFLNYVRLRFSFFGVGTKLKLGGKVYYLNKIDWTYIEFINKEEHTVLYMPISKFLAIEKEVLFNGEQK